MTEGFVLETERLLLRAYRANDLAALVPILSDPLAMRFYPAPFDEGMCVRWIERNRKRYADDGFGLWVVELKREGRFIGDCGITRQRIDGALLPEIGYHIDSRYTRQGYATEAARACVGYAFDALGFDAVYSYSRWDNLPSQRVAQKIGMRFCAEYNDPVNTKTRVYFLTRDEYRAQQASKIETAGGV